MVMGFDDQLTRGGRVRMRIAHSLAYIRTVATCVVVCSVEETRTVKLKWIAPLCSRYFVLLDHYKSNLANLSDLYSPMTKLYKSER